MPSQRPPVHFESLCLALTLVCLLLLILGGFYTKNPTNVDLRLTAWKNNSTDADFRKALVNHSSERVWTLLLGENETNVVKLLSSSQLPLTYLTAIELQEVENKSRAFQDNPRYLRSSVLWDKDEGFTRQVYNFKLLLIFAAVQNLSLRSAYFTPAYQDAFPLISTESLFDVPYLNQQMRGFILSPSSAERRKVADTRDVRSHVSFSDMNCSQQAYDKAKTLVEAALRPAKWIQDFTDACLIKLETLESARMETVGLQESIHEHIIVNPASKLRFACLHLRIEKDYADMYGGGFKYASPQDVITRTLRYVNSSNHTSVFKLHDMPWFLAGAHNDSELLTLLRANLGVVYTKETLLSPEHLAFQVRPGKPRTLPAIADFEICSRASIFLGNRYSSWSANIFYRFRQRGAESMAFDYAGRDPYEIHPFRSYREFEV